MQLILLLLQGMTLLLMYIAVLLADIWCHIDGFNVYAVDSIVIMVIDIVNSNPQQIYDT